MVTIQIDGREFEVEPGKNLLETCLTLGLNLPYFCWHPAMGSVGACRQCAVVQYQNAEDTRGRIVMGCMTPVSDGAIFSLSGDKASGFREAIVESLMLNHPHDCPVCAEGGECHLQDMTVMVGHRDRKYRGRKNTHRNQYLGPLINHEMNRCITCYRCTRYYRDYAGGTDLAALASRDRVYFGRHEEGTLESEFAGNLVEVCPTGVFTDKTLVHDYTRKWDLQSAPSVCTGCAYGCNTLPGERYGRLKRVHNRFNAEVNGYFLCDRGRYGSGYINTGMRLDFPGLRDAQGKYAALSERAAWERLRGLCGDGTIAAIGSPRASVESNFLLRQIAGEDSFAPGFAHVEQALVRHALDLQLASGARTPDLRAIESADAVLILGEDVTNTAPRLALALRQSVRNKAYAMAADLRLLPWQDAAIRNLAQDVRSPLYIADTGNTRLDDVATARFSLSPATIAEFGAAIAARLGGNDLATGDSDLDAQIIAVADALRTAERPLIISGTGSMDAAIMTAAADVAEALGNAGTPAMLSLVVPEANSLGQALLCDADAPTLNALEQRARNGEFSTLVILENDLFRRGAPQRIKQLLSAFDTVVAIDGMDNRTTSEADLVLPAASTLETEGTLISMEGRAQRHYPVFPSAEGREPAWHWLLELAHCRGVSSLADVQSFDDLTRACADSSEKLSGIHAAAPTGDYRSHGVKIPRQPLRYSGRTAMRANVSVHEPKQPTDEDSPLAYSMEGLNRDEPSSLLPYVWSPGWNSNQSLHRFQAEVGGPIRGGSAGVRLLPENAVVTDTTTTTAAAMPIVESGEFQLVPRWRIFGSDELSAASPGLSDLVESGFLELSEKAATELNVVHGDGLVVGDDLATLRVKINNEMASGCVGFSVGLAGCEALTEQHRVSLRRADDWRRDAADAELISSDRRQHG